MPEVHALAVRRYVLELVAVFFRGGAEVRKAEAAEFRGRFPDGRVEGDLLRGNGDLCAMGEVEASGEGDPSFGLDFAVECYFEAGGLVVNVETG